MQEGASHISSLTLNGWAASNCPPKVTSSDESIGVDIVTKEIQEQEGLSRRLFLSGTAAAGIGSLAVEMASFSAEASTQVAAAEVENLPRVKQELVAPPFLPKSMTRSPRAARRSLKSLW